MRWKYHTFIIWSIMHNDNQCTSYATFNKYLLDHYIIEMNDFIWQYASQYDVLYTTCMKQIKAHIQSTTKSSLTLCYKNKMNIQVTWYWWVRMTHQTHAHSMPSRFCVCKIQPLMWLAFLSFLGYIFNFTNTIDLHRICIGDDYVHSSFLMEYLLDVGMVSDIKLLLEWLC